MTPNMWRRLLAILAVGIFAFGLAPAPAHAQVSTGDVAGTAKDVQGGVIPGATVTLVSLSRGTSMDTATNESGAFIFTNVAADTYTIKVTMDGFKTLERPSVPVSAVIVSGEVPMIQARSGERSFTATTEAVQNLPVANRNFANLSLLAPGVGTNPSGAAMRLELNSPTDQTIHNPQYNADGTLNQARITPKTAGFGAVNGAQAMRTVQVQLRFQF